MERVKMMDVNQFIEIMGKDRSCGLIPPEIDAQSALNILQEVLLSGAHSPVSLNEAQNNSYVLHHLLSRYSRKYDKAVLKIKKENINPNEGFKY